MDRCQHFEMVQLENFDEILGQNRRISDAWNLLDYHIHDHLEDHLDKYLEKG